MEFKTWTARCDAVLSALLRAMLTQAAPEAKAALAPAGDGDAMTFRLREGLFVARRG